MRDIFVILVVFGTLPFILKRPYIGILLWSWLGYMNPHKLSWGIATEMPFAQITALVTVAGLVLNYRKEPVRMVWTRETILLVFFIFWMFVSTLDAVFPHFAWPQMNKVFKIQVMTFITLLLINERYRIHLLIWMIALSLGFYGVKGGIFTITTGGGYQVRGPLGTFIGGNNEIGLAMIMTLPLMRYLHLQADKIWLKLGLAGAMFFTVVAVLGTQSRGALVGLVVMGAYFFLKSRNKFFIALPIMLIVPLALSFMPQSWWDRMNTIRTYEADQSVNERFDAWAFAIRQALNDPFTGGGYNVFAGKTDAHSIYFEILGEHGFVGLGLFLLLGLLTLSTGNRIKRMTRKVPELLWAQDLATMIQVSLVGYAASGAFLGLAYFDLYYHLVVIMVMLRVVVEAQLDTGVKQQDEVGAFAPARFANTR